LPLVEPLVLEVPLDLAHLASPDSTEGMLFAEEMLGEIRSAVYWEFGVVVPPLRVKIGGGLPAGRYRILLFEQPMGGGLLIKDRLAVKVGAEMPEGGVKVSWSLDEEYQWFEPSMEEALYDGDFVVMDALALMAHHFGVCVRRNLGELVNMETAQILIRALEKTHPALMETIYPDPVSLPILTAVLKRLAQEGVSLRHLDRIVAALGDWVPREGDPVLLTEYVRMELRREVSGRYARERMLPVYLASQSTEDEIRAGITRGDKGSFLSLDPEVTMEIQEKAKKIRHQFKGDGAYLVVLSSMEIRRYLRQILVLEVPDIVVLSYQELENSLQVQPLGEL
ncbi:flagellar biosynthesis protein FlhA, partial [Myxococcota bacterium]|nr:flagellar biosynthesis protein FlhA [Myxococcota bacterium]